MHDLEATIASGASRAAAAASCSCVRVTMNGARWSRPSKAGCATALREFGLRFMLNPGRSQAGIVLRQASRTYRSGLDAVSRALISSALIVGCAPPEVRTAEQLAALGQWDAAVAAYREAQKQAPFDETIRKRLQEAKARAAEQHDVEGRRLLEGNQVAEALSEFKVALGLDPSRSEYHAAMGDALRLREAREQLQLGDKLRSLGRLAEALEAYERASELDPNLTRALEGITAMTKQQRAGNVLGGSGQPITLRFQNARLKEVFEILARAGDLNVIFDREVRDDPVTIFIKDTSFDEALNLILNTNALFARRIGPDTLLIIPNTKLKQDQYQDLMIRTFYLSNARAKDLANLLRTMLESKHVYVNEPLNAIVVRDQPIKLQLAERILLANDRRESEVELDVEVLEVNRTKSQQYGLNFAKSAAAGAFPPGFGGALSSAASRFTYRQLTDLGPDSYLLSLQASLLLDFFKQESNAKTLASPKLRVLNGKQASVNIGEKQPILLSTTNVLPGQAATGAVPTTSTVTSIEFKDTGVKLTVEPTIHLADELTLKLKIEVTRLGDLVTLQASPEIKQFRFGTRTAETILNMNNDESVILAGLIQDEDRKTRVTVPGLGEIPVLGEVFSTTNQEAITTEVVLTITPHIIRNVAMPGIETQTFWSGTETTYAMTPLFTSRVPDPPAAMQTRDPAGLSLTPSELSTDVGQEFRLDLTADQVDVLGDSAVILSYDPQVIEFHRALERGRNQLEPVEPLAPLTVDTANGHVTIRLRQQDASTIGPGILTTLVFQAKTSGTSSITIQRSMGDGPAAGLPSATIERGFVHVR